MPDAFLDATDLRRSFAGLRAVDGVSLRMVPGEVLGLIGPNGAGKTTLFNLLAGALPPDSGTIRLGGRDVTREDARLRPRAGMGRTFQIPRPFAAMTVLENVLTAAPDQTGERPLAALLTPGRVRAEERRHVARAREILDCLTLTRLAAEPAAVLSGGQRKLLELARVMMAGPRLILLDEPAAGVNPALLALIEDRLAAINATGVGLLLIEHNLDMVRRLCPRVVVMAEGRVLAEGTPDAVTADPAVAEAYLGAAA